MLKAVVKNLYFKSSSIIPQIARYVEYRRQKHRINERGVEFAFVFKCLRDLAPKSILDVGSGTSALPAIMSYCGAVVDAVDQKSSYWGTMSNRHWPIQKGDITLEFEPKQKYDMITCISVLEHIPDFDAALQNMLSSLKPGGHLVLTGPYNHHRYIENAYKLPGCRRGQGARFITQQFSNAELSKHGRIVESEYWQLWDGETWAVGEDVVPPKMVSTDVLHHHCCLLIQRCDDTTASQGES